MSPNKSTLNITMKTKEEFNNWLRESEIENIEADIVEIDNKIEDLKAKIDALVFKIYGLNNEVKIVPNSLKTHGIYQAKVLRFLELMVC